VSQYVLLYNVFNRQYVLTKDVNMAQLVDILRVLPDIQVRVHCVFRFSDIFSLSL